MEVRGAKSQILCEVRAANARMQRLNATGQRRGALVVAEVSGCGRIGLDRLWLENEAMRTG